jgi:penicillin-binding protein 1C
VNGDDISAEANAMLMTGSQWARWCRTRLIASARLRLAVAGAGAVLALAAWVRLGPLPPGLLDEQARPSTVLVDRHGTPLYEARSTDATRGTALSPDQLPPTLVAATLAAEDRRYYAHRGVDPVSVVRALRTNLAEGRVVEGASTISMQVAKLLLTRRDPDRVRGGLAKLHEALVALRLEHRFTKAEILARYLSLASYGNQFIGAERASQGYFGVAASMLTPAQAAFLAGLPQRPSAFNPYRAPEAARARQRTVLRRMAVAGALAADTLAVALDERLVFAPSPSSFTAPHFVEMVLASLEDARPAVVETTLDGPLQSDLAGIITRHRADLVAHGAHNVAVVVLDNASGEWVAWEGSGDYADAAHGGAINGPVTLRQPGSTLKPFTYALAFEDGAAPTSVLADVPASFPTGEPGIVYSPRNYDGVFRGPMLARQALAGSINVPAVQLASRLGVPQVLRFLRRAGFTTLDKTAAYYGLGITLGNAEVRLDELTAAYAAFARGGERVTPTFLRRPRDDDLERQRLVSDRTAFWITDVLADADARAFVFGRGGSLELPFPVAVKTGTSQAYHDNWTVGYSRRATVGVWVGNFDRRPLRNSSGVTGAAPIFQAVMLAAERRLAGEVAADDRGEVVSRPSDLVGRDICAESGQAANAWCPLKRREWVALAQTDAPCAWHHLDDEGLHTYLPTEFQAWAAAQGRRADRRPAGRVEASRHVGRAAPSGTSAPSALAIASPPDGATYLIDPTLRREFQTVVLRATAPEGRRVEWRVSGRLVGAGAAADGIEWPLAPGTHRIEATDARGRTAEATITVR